MPPKHTIPNRHTLEKKYLGKIPTYSRILDMLQAQLKHELIELGLHPTIRSRVKSFGSYYEKILRLLAKGKSSEEAFLIYDVIGLRIVCPFLDDLKIVEEHIGGKFDVFQTEYKGSEHTFREFGYQSIHFLIHVPQGILLQCSCEGSLLCEIQLRTILQDAWSEVEHELIYKSDFSPFDEPMKRKLAALNANLTLSDTLFQEIRDYQRTLQIQLQKRRRDFLTKVKNPETHVPAPLGNSRPDPAKKEKNRPPDFVCAEKSVDDLLVDALVAHNSGDFKKAIDVYSNILLRDFPEHIKSIIYIHRGMAFFAESEYERALYDFSAALELNADNYRALYYRGCTYQMMQKQEAALDDFTSCLEINPYQFEPLYRRAQLYAVLGERRKALSDCNRALKIEPSSSEALHLKKTLSSRGNPSR